MSSLATSSDCTTIRSDRSIGSTTYSMAAMARCVSDTNLVVRSRMPSPAGDRHSTVRSRVPARRSRRRRCDSRVP